MNEIADLYVTLRAVGGDFQKGMAESGLAAGKAEKSIAKMQAAAAKAAAAVDRAAAEQAAAQERLAAVVAETTAKQQAAQDRLVAANEAVARKTGIAGANLKAQLAEQAAAQRAVADAAEESATKQIEAQKAVEAATAKLTAAQDAAAAARVTTGQKVSSLLSKTTSIVAKATVAGALIVSAASVKEAADFQKSTTLLQTAGGETAAHMKTVANGILNVAQSTGTSVSQLTDGMYIVEKAGYRSAAGVQVLKAAAQGAKAENVDLSTATTALTSVMMSYHDKANQAVSVQNMLVAGAGAAKTTMQEYAGSLSTVIPIASAAHINFAQVAGAIATLTQHGTSAQEATQELANTIRNLQAPNQVAQKAMQQLGINVTDLETHLGQRGLTGTLGLIESKLASSSKAGLVVVSAFKKSASATKDLQDEISHMSPSLAAMSQQFEKGQISYKDYYTNAKSLGGQQYELAKGFISTMGAAKGFNSLLTSGQPAVQTAANALKQMLGGATGLNTALMLGGENAKYFGEATQRVGEAGKKSGQDIATWAQTSKTLSVELARLREFVQVLLIDIGQKLIPVVTAIVSWMLKHRQVCIDLAIGLGTLTTALTVTYGAMKVIALFGEEGPLSPWMIAIAALIVAATLLATHWKQVWDGVKTAYTTVWNALKTAFNATVDFLKQWGPLILTIVAPVVGLPLLIWQHWSQITHYVSQAWTDAVNWLKKLPGMILGVFKDAGSWLLQAGEDVINGLIHGIENKVSDLGHTISGIAGKITGGFKKALSIFSPSKVMATEVGQWIPLGIAEGMLAHGGALTDAGRKIVESFVNDQNKLVKTLGSGTNKQVTSAAETLLKQATKISGVDQGKEGASSALVAFLVKDTQQLDVLTTKRDAVAKKLKTAVSADKKLVSDFTTLKSSLGKTTADITSAGNAYVNEAKALGESSKTINQLKKDNSKLQQLAAQRDTLTANIAGSQNLATSISNTVSGTFDVTSAGQLTDLAGNTTVSFGQMQAQLTQSVNNAQKFATDYASLQQKVKQLPKNVQPAFEQMVGQLGQAGPAALPQVDALLGAGLSDLTSFATQLTSLSSASSSISDTASTAIYGDTTKGLQGSLTKLNKSMSDTVTQMQKTGENAANGLIKGLKSKDAALTKQISATGSAMVKTIKSDLKIKSPSQVFDDVGQQVTAGIVSGLKTGSGAVYKQIKAIADGMLATLKKELAISSPSRVMADQIGQHIPAGLAMGITGNTAPVTSAMKSLSNIVTGTKFSTGSGPVSSGGGVVVHNYFQIGGSVVDANGLISALSSNQSAFARAVGKAMAASGATQQVPYPRARRTGR